MALLLNAFNLDNVLRASSENFEKYGGSEKIKPTGFSFHSQILVASIFKIRDCFSRKKVTNIFFQNFGNRKVIFNKNNFFGITSGKSFKT